MIVPLTVSGRPHNFIFMDNCDSFGGYTDSAGNDIRSSVCDNAWRNDFAISGVGTCRMGFDGAAATNAQVSLNLIGAPAYRSRWLDWRENL